MNNKDTNHKLPCNFVFNITDHCNLKCRHCDIWRNAKEDNNELSIEQWKEVAKKIHAWVGPFNVVISGGEPFTKEGLLDFIIYLKGLGVGATISTNGTLLNAYLDRLSNIDLVNLSISLDSRFGISDWTRNTPGVTETILSNLDALLNLDKHPPIQIDTIIMKQNLDEIIGLTDWTREKGVVLNLNPLTEDFAENNKREDWYKHSNLWPNSQDANKLIDQIIDRKNNGYGNIANPIDQLEVFKHYYRDPTRSMIDYLCRVGEKNFAVGSSGTVSICQIAFDIGNIINQSPEDIWSSAKAQEAREKIAQCKSKSCYVLGCYFR